MFLKYSSGIMYPDIIAAPCYMSITYELYLNGHLIFYILLPFHKVLLLARLSSHPIPPNVCRHFTLNVNNEYLMHTNIHIQHTH